MKLSLALFFATTLIVSAQNVEVPHKLHFADMTLTIRDDARREIQKDVDALTRYPKSFNIKVERARTFFPLIEKIFAEENVPDDFKYLVIQESALISDAVSVSNAVGYWQFKDFTAIEMGLRIDKHVDERMNIVSSTRAAARYIKKNNTFFNNWLYALQAYQMGAGGVLRSEKDSKSGQKQMDITSNTYWYVKKYLAHKIAYEGFVKGSPEIQVLTYDSRNGKRTLSEIAREVNVEEEQVKLYNKWLKSDRIPEDRSYSVVIPVKGDPSGVKLPEAIASTSTPGLHENSTKAGTAKDSHARVRVNGSIAIRINGITAIRAVDKETPTMLASRAGVDLSMFLKWNDITISDRLNAGTYYLLGKKRSRAENAYHKVQPDESLWSISQQHGVQMKKIRKYNRIGGDADLKPGMTLWLSGMKPKDGKTARKIEEAVEVNQTETFAWEVTATEEKGPQSSGPQPQQGGVTEAPVEVVEDAPIQESDPTEKADTVITSSPAQVITIPSDTVTTALRNPVSEVVTASIGKNPDQHIVQQGETLYGIARQYKVGVMDLVNWNSLDLQQGIKPGQILSLRSAEAEMSEEPAPSNPVNLIHEVKSSDTVYSIARKYGVTIKDLMEWNNKKDFNLSVGEKLKIIKN